MHAVYKEYGTMDRYNLCCIQGICEVGFRNIAQQYTLRWSISFCGSDNSKLADNRHEPHVGAVWLCCNNQMDLHHFLWSEDPEELILEYRMTRLTFGVCASSFAADIVLRQNTIDHSRNHPQASQVVLKSFYVDDRLTGAD